VKLFLAEQRTSWFSRVRLTAAPPASPFGEGDRDLAMDIRRALSAGPPHHASTAYPPGVKTATLVFMDASGGTLQRIRG
jgi:hypothetical protein